MAKRNDIVYVVKNCVYDEELRYSLRSVEKNWPYNKVWFYGGKPNGLEPDFYVKVAQTARTKWENVRNMMVEICQNEDITPDFWLFNDDFFIMEPMDGKIKAWVDGTLSSKIERVKAKHNGQHSQWTRNLERLAKRLKEAGKPELNYAVHTPMLVNRQKMLEVLLACPREPMIRSLYGNWWGVKASEIEDPKHASQNDHSSKIGKMKLLSTSDESFRAGYVGRVIRDKFQEKSRFEV